MQTTEYRIEREIVIDAPVDVVWRTITEPDQITRWFADTVELELEPGAHGYMGFGEHGGGTVVVDTVEPPTRFSFRWNQPAEEEPAAGNSLLVEFTLEGDGEQTRLTVVESGLDLLGWSTTEKQRYTDEHNGGWADFLDRLATLLAERPRG